MADGAPRPCPRCSVAMSVHRTVFAELDVCPRCKGTFFDVGEGVAAHGPTVEASFLVGDGSAERLRPGLLRCPAHGVHAQEGYRGEGRFEPVADAPQMDLYVVRAGRGAVEVDVCPTCRGFFLDAGEPEQLLALARDVEGSGAGAASFWQRLWSGG